MLLLDLARLHRGEALEAKIEDRLRLLARELEVRNQAVARCVRIARAANQLDDSVEVLERDEQALEDVGPSLRPAKLVLRAPDDDLALMIDVVADHRLEAERARHAVHERDHVHAEGGLHRRVLVELVEHHARVDVALELDHHADAGLVRLVAQVGDLRDLLVVDDLGDLLDEPGALVATVALRHLVGQLGDDDRLLALAQRLDMSARLNDHAAAAAFVGIPDAGDALDDSAGGEVRALHVLHQADGADLRVVDVRDNRVDRLAQVVRRDVGGHADRDARRAVDQQVREARRKDGRLHPRLVVVGSEVDGVGIDVAQHLGGESREPRLGVPHGRGWVVVDRAKVALAVHQRVALGEVLGEADEGVVDRLVAVRMEVAHHAADDVGALAVRPVGLQPRLVHREEHAPVHRLEAVAHIGERAADDHAYGVIEVRRPHLLLEPARLDAAAGECVHRSHLATRPGW